MAASAGIHDRSPCAGVYDEDVQKDMDADKHDPWEIEYLHVVAAVDVGLHIM